MKKRGNNLFLLVVFTILLASFVNAETDAEINKTQAYERMYEEMNSRAWSGNVEEVAFAVLALGSGGYNISDGIAELRNLEYSGGYWDTIKDTSLSILALRNSGEDVTEEVEWLNTQYVIAFSGGEWYIQVDTESEGECELDHEQTDTLFSFSVNDSYISSACGESNWLNFESCVSLVGIKEDISISCDLGGTYTPTLLWQSSDEYYLFDQGRDLDLENGCFVNSQGSCNCEQTGYAALVLDRLGKETYVNPYMRFKCPQNIIRNSFLYTLLDSSDTGPYAVWLKESQWPDGSWGVDAEGPGEEEFTALGILALKQKPSSNREDIVKATQWLASRQGEDGSWNSNVRDTALVMYVLYGKQYVPPVGDPDGNFCGDGYRDDDEDCEFDEHCNVTNNEICTSLCECIPADETNETGNPMDPLIDPCGDGYCDRLGGESCSSCFSDCSEYCLEEGDECEEDSDCGIGEICNPITKECEDEDEDDPGNEDECIDDDDCDDGERCNKATGECEKKSSWLKWLVAVLAILLGVAIFYYLYMRYFKDKLSKGKGGGKKQQPPSGKPFPFKTTQRVPIKRPPTTTRRPSSRDARLEKELEESLKKARDVLKK